MIPPPLLTELEEDEEKDQKKWDGWMDGWVYGSPNGVISRAPVELIRIDIIYIVMMGFILRLSG